MRKPKFKRLLGGTDAVFVRAAGHARKGESASEVRVSITEREHDGALIIEVDNFVGRVTILAPGGIHMDLLPIHAQRASHLAMLPCLGKRHVGDPGSSTACRGSYPNGRVVPRCDKCIERSRKELEE